MTTATEVHTHDLGILVSVADVSVEDFSEVKRRLRAALIDVIKELNLPADVMTTYDGRVECGEHA